MSKQITYSYGDVVNTACTKNFYIVVTKHLDNYEYAPMWDISIRPINAEGNIHIHATSKISRKEVFNKLRHKMRLQRDFLNLLLIKH